MTKSHTTWCCATCGARYETAEEAVACAQGQHATCPECGGSGGWREPLGDPDDPEEELVMCPTCCGSGVADDEPEAKG